jgi:hypothetical protein
VNCPNLQNIPATFDPEDYLSNLNRSDTFFAGNCKASQEQMFKDHARVENVIPERIYQLDDLILVHCIIETDQTDYPASYILITEDNVVYKFYQPFQKKLIPPQKLSSLSRLIQNDGVLGEMFAQFH